MKLLISILSLLIVSVLTVLVLILSPAKPTNQPTFIPMASTESPAATAAPLPLSSMELPTTSQDKPEDKGDSFTLRDENDEVVNDHNGNDKALVDDTNELTDEQDVDMKALEKSHEQVLLVCQVKGDATTQKGVAFQNREGVAVFVASKKFDEEFAGMTYCFVTYFGAGRNVVFEVRTPTKAEEDVVELN